MKDFGLVVIGAHFGVWLESEITKYKNQNILLVEPVPYNYNILKDNFKDSKNIYICTNAIFSENKLDKFYYVNKNSISKLGKHWASGIGSFNKNHILEHKTKRFKIEPEDIDEIEIKFIDNKDNFNDSDWNSLYKLAEDTFVEESDSLKQGAAGAGLTDND